MKNKIRKIALFSTFAILSMSSLTGCNFHGQITVGPNNPEIDENVTPEAGGVDQNLTPVSGYINGGGEKNKTADEIYNTDGGLMIPFDMAYPEYMNQALYDENSILVKCLNSDINEIVSTLSNDGVSGFKFVSKSTDSVSWFKLSLNNVKSNEVINTYRKMNTKAMMFDLNYVIDKTGLYATPSDTTTVTSSDTSTTIDNCNIDGAELNPFFKDQFYFKGYGLKESYKYIKDNALLNGGAGTVVAVIDTGVDLDHEDLVDNIYHNTGEVPNNNIDDDQNGFVDDVTGWNFVDNNNIPDDDQGHGTHVAGIIGATKNRIGTLGIAYNAKILPIKAGDGAGFFSQDNIAKAINYAYLNNADVINMSFGGSTISLAVQEALEAAYTTSSLIAAAGNDGLPNEKINDCKMQIMPSYPAALSYVLGVMSVNAAGIESGFSNFDGKAHSDREYEVYAPGEGIYSTIPDNKYTALNGTSMAAPIVSGMAALLRSKYQDRTQYPSKFITAQIAGAPTTHATCCNPKEHKDHNLAPIVNIFSSFMSTPKPNVSLLTYRVFDLKEYSQANNGNGTLDAGETVYLAPTLINRWGMSKETTITFDTKSSISNQESKYVQIENPTLNFDGVGTYSRKHYLTLDSTNSNYVGCDTSKSLKITLSKDAPNLVNIPLNYTVSAKNALDEKDQNTYTTKGKVTLTINHGTILPKVIYNDMTLTKDNYYIIDEPLYVNEGVTLTVTEGTTIQFGLGKDNGYQGANKESPRIHNYGTINMVGTANDLIDLHSADYYSSVYIWTYDNAATNISYAKIHNPAIHYQTSLDHINFTYNNSSSSFIFDGKHTYVNNEIYCDKISNCTFENDISCTVGSVEISATEAIENSVFIRNGMSADRGFIYDTLRSVFKNCTFINNSKSTYSQSIQTNSLNGSSYNKFMGHGWFPYYNGFNMIGHVDEYIELVKKINQNENIIHVNPLKAEEDFKIFHNTYLDYVLIKRNDQLMLLDGTIITEADRALNTLIYDNFFGEYGAIHSTAELSRCLISLDDSGKAVSVAVSDMKTDYNNEAIADKNKLQTRLWEIDGKPTVSDNACNNFLSADNNNFAIVATEDTITKGHTINNAVILNTDDAKIKDDMVRDGNDNPNKAILGEASLDDPAVAKLWPFVTKCTLTDKDGVAKNTFGKETINITLQFNRDLNTEVPLRVRFGSSEPYAEYEIDGKFTSNKTWTGSFYINTTIENGLQYIRIDGGQALDDAFMSVMEAPGRFKFNIDTTVAMSQVINATAKEEGIALSWSQDEYSLDTIMGYNVYKSDKKDGLYQKVNRNVISKDENSYLDAEVLPGETYWYTFTMVLSDLSETNPVGKAAVTARDTMSPSIYHTPVYQGYTTDPLKITCKVKDNIGVTGVKLYYRTTGQSEFKSLEMNHVNDIYSVAIPVNDLNIAGLEYYIEATDGFNFEYMGSATNPYQVIIKDGQLIASLGDVDGDGEITIIDAQMILNQINGESILTPEQFQRADLDKDGELATYEALKILQYINGTITSLNN